ncbi:MAG: nitroreductase family protein [Elusimicrobia bacterium]|nr:nitroreductase family protein [Elusimicrobiota bacterium]
MSAMDAIRLRRSVRAYAPRPVDEPTVRRLLDAAVHAPTAMHEEPWAFAVIQDRAVLKRLSDKAKETLDEVAHRLRPHASPADHVFIPPENVFYDAGTLIVVYGRPMGPFVAADCWLAAENLMLAARAMGLGTCVIGLAVPALNAPEWKAELGVPAELTAYAPIVVGTPAGQTPPVGRREPEVLAWRRGG